jgi:hypothetical protein
MCNATLFADLVVEPHRLLSYFMWTYEENR